MMDTLEVQPYLSATSMGKTPMLLDLLGGSATPMPRATETKFTFILVGSSTPQADAPAIPEGTLLVADLGWTHEQAEAVHAQLAAFEEGWDAPGMDAYDAL